MKGAFKIMFQPPHYTDQEGKSLRLLLRKSHQLSSRDLNPGVLTPSSVRLPPNTSLCSLAPMWASQVLSTHQTWRATGQQPTLMGSTFHQHR